MWTKRSHEAHGLEPAPERSRKTIWKELLSRHWEVIVAADFLDHRGADPVGPDEISGATSR